MFSVSRSMIATDDSVSYLMSLSCIKVVWYCLLPNLSELTSEITQPDSAVLAIRLKTIIIKYFLLNLISTCKPEFKNNIIDALLTDCCTKLKNIQQPFLFDNKNILLHLKFSKEMVKKKHEDLAEQRLESIEGSLSKTESYIVENQNVISIVVGVIVVIILLLLLYHPSLMIFL